METYFNIKPIAAPRMTQADRWKKRPIVLRYWDYKDQLREHMEGVDLPESYHIHFIIGMAKSWSKKKKALMVGKPHKQRPDKDNLEKGFLDALFSEDCEVWDGRVTKWWGYKPGIVIESIDPPKESPLLQEAFKE